MRMRLLFFLMYHLSSIATSLYSLRSWDVLNMSSSVKLSGMISGYYSDNNGREEIWMIYGTDRTPSPTVPSHIAYHLNPFTHVLTASVSTGTDDFYVNGQAFTFSTNTLYLTSRMQDNHYLSKFNMNTGESTPEFSAIPGSSYSPCLVICANSNLLYVIGNEGSNAEITQTFNVDDNVWTNSISAKLNDARSRHSCECINGVLWAFGGVMPPPFGSYNQLDSVEYYDTVSSSSWIQLIDTLSQPIFWTRSVVVENDIINIGGSDTSGIKRNVDVIHTNSRTITSGPPLNFVRYLHAAVYSPIVNRIFICGGSDNSPTSPVIYLWEMSNVLDPTLNPTSIPTTNPTYNPTINPTKNPTYIPTYYPSTNPTKTPTLNPTNIPTTNPTYNPTISTTQNHILAQSSTSVKEMEIQSTTQTTVDILSYKEPVDCAKCRMREGLHCMSGTQPYNDDDKAIWCEPCPSGTAGIDGVCNECDGLTEPNHNGDDCVDSDVGEYVGEIIGAVIGVIITVLFGVFVWCYKETIKRKLCPKSKTAHDSFVEMHKNNQS
eukprot:274407_1